MTKVIESAFPKKVRPFVSVKWQNRIPGYCLSMGEGAREVWNTYTAIRFSPFFDVPAA